MRPKSDLRTNAAEKKFWPNWNSLRKGSTLRSKQY